MKSFKQFLAEVYGQGPTKDFVFDGSYYPISPSMFKRVFGEKKFTAFHIASLGGIEKLMKIQKTQKSISTLTNIEDSNLLINGIGGGGGGLAMVSGNKLVQSEKDLHSQVDSNGYRWIKLSEQHDPDFEDILGPLLYQAKENSWEKHKKELEAAVDVSEIFFADFMTQWEEITTIKDKKLKGKVIATFFDEVERLTKKKKDIVEDLFSRPPDVAALSGRMQLSADETVMNNFTIQRIWLITPASQRKVRGYKPKMDEFVKKYEKKYKVEVLKWNIGDLKRIKNYIKAVARNRSK